MARSKAADKPALGASLKPALKSHGFTLTQAARTLEINPASFRAWVSRNSFPQRDLQRIANLAGLPTDLRVLSALYTFSKHAQPEFVPSDPVFHSLGAVLSFMDVRATDAEKSYTDFGQDVQLLFSALNGGDIFVYSALDEFPYEVDQQGWAVAGPAIAQAVERGAFFIYLYPSERLVAAMKDLKLRKIPDPNEFLGALKFMKDQIQGERPQLNREHIDNHIVAVPCEMNPFMVPACKFVLFKPKLPTSARALARFPIGTEKKVTFLHLPLSDGITRQFFNVVIELLHKEKREDLVSLFRYERNG